MKFLSRVVWSEGMHLGPHQFQAKSRYFEDTPWFLNSNLRQTPALVKVRSAEGVVKLVQRALPGDLGDATFYLTIIMETQA
jgi:predicted component of type VI protein secretion system